LAVFLLIGFLVPVIELSFAIQMASVSVMKKAKSGATYIAPGKPSYETDVLYLLLAIMIVLGAGAFSVDGALGL
jgi:uncharacterized membrane protein YphA (DoxX/SURF4 family)